MTAGDTICPECGGRRQVPATPGQPGDGPMPCPYCSSVATIRRELACVDSGPYTDALVDALDVLEARDKNLTVALRGMLELLERHDLWCGHNAEAPGDSIVNSAPRFARAVLADEEDAADAS